jgi:hydroxymethylpyrimidine/phosphomethylpyrimidine kinase
MTTPLPSPAPPVALTIAGSDPSGGAGLQADLKMFQQHQVYGMSVVTLLTVQNTQTVSAVEILPAKLVVDQLVACIEDIQPQAAKTGALGSPEVIEAIASYAFSFEFPLVVDPVMVSKHRVPLMADQAIEVLIKNLLPHCFLITPNLPEAEKLVRREIVNLEQMKSAAQQIADLGPKHVFLKGGHLTDQATDILYSDGQLFELHAQRIDTQHTHGTGCTTSAAITAWLAKGTSVVLAVERAKRFITSAIASSPGLGKGFGPVNFFIVPKE